MSSSLAVSLASSLSHSDPVVIHTCQQPGQNVEQFDVQFAREIGIWQAEKMARQRRRLRIGVSGKDEGHSGGVALRKYPEIAGLSDVNEQVSMTLGHVGLQHRENPDKPILIEVVVRDNVGFNVETGASRGS